MEHPASQHHPIPPGVATAAAGDRRGQDRRQRRGFVLRERRTGFDRRTGAADQDGMLPAVRHGLARILAHLRDQPLMLLGLIVAMNVLSLIDFALTLRALELGAVELNPVIRPLLDRSPVLAGAVKVLLVGSASLLIWRFRRYKLVLQVAVIGPLFFALVNFYHVTFGFIL